MNLRKEIRNCLDRTFNPKDDYTDVDCIDDISELVIIDDDENGDDEVAAEFNNRVCEILAALCKDGYTASNAVADIDRIVEMEGNK